MHALIKFTKFIAIRSYVYTMTRSTYFIQLELLFAPRTITCYTTGLGHHNSISWLLYIHDCQVDVTLLLLSICQEAYQDDHPTIFFLLGEGAITTMQRSPLHIPGSDRCSERCRVVNVVKRRTTRTRNNKKSDKRAHTTKQKSPIS